MELTKLRTGSKELGRGDGQSRRKKARELIKANREEGGRDA